MSITQRIIEAIEGKKQTVPGEICAVCGGTETVEEWHLLKKVLSGNFTDFNLIADKRSNAICSFCVSCLSDLYMTNKNGKKCGLRWFSFLIENGSFYPIEREQRKEYLFDRVFEQPFILAFSESMPPKHVSFKCVESNDPHRFWVCGENSNVFFDRTVWLPVYETANDCYAAGINKSELLSGKVAPWKFNKYVIDYSKLKALQKYRNTQQFELIVSILKREEKTCTKESKQQSQLTLPFL